MHTWSSEPGRSSGVLSWCLVRSPTGSYGVCVRFRRRFYWATRRPPEHRLRRLLDGPQSTASVERKRERLRCIGEASCSTSSLPRQYVPTLKRNPVVHYTTSNANPKKKKILSQSLSECLSMHSMHHEECSLNAASLWDWIPISRESTTTMRWTGEASTWQTRMDI